MRRWRSLAVSLARMVASAAMRGAGCCQGWAVEMRAGVALLSPRWVGSYNTTSLTGCVGLPATGAVWIQSADMLTSASHCVPLLLCSEHIGIHGVSAWSQCLLGHTVPCRPAGPAASNPSAGDELKQLIALRTSSRYLDRLAAGLQQKAGQEAKFHRQATRCAAATPAAGPANPLMHGTASTSVCGQRVCRPHFRLAAKFRGARKPATAARSPVGVQLACRRVLRPSGGLNRRCSAGCIGVTRVRWLAAVRPVHKASRTVMNMT